MKKLLLLLFIFPLFIACSSDDDDNKYYWEVYISNWKEIECSSNIIRGYPQITSYKITQSEMEGWIDQINKDFQKDYNEGEIDCLPIAAYRKADK